MKKFLSRDLILQLREMARKGASIRMMVEVIRSHTNTNDGLALVVDRYFKEAFLLPLGDIRHIEGSSCLGGKVYDDKQIDEILLPLISMTRERWENLM